MCVGDTQYVIMEIFTMRLPHEAINELERRARMAFMPVRTLARTWFLQRLDAENQKKDITPATGAEFGDDTLAAGCTSVDASNQPRPNGDGTNGIEHCSL